MQGVVSINGFALDVEKVFIRFCPRCRRPALCHPTGDRQSGIKKTSYSCVITYKSPIATVIVIAYWVGYC